MYVYRDKMNEGGVFYVVNEGANIAKVSVCSEFPKESNLQCKSFNGLVPVWQVSSHSLS